jgi:hypothetical protein
MGLSVDSLTATGRGVLCESATVYVCQCEYILLRVHYILICVHHFDKGRKKYDDSYTSFISF